MCQFVSIRLEPATFCSYALPHWERVPRNIAKANASAQNRGRTTIDMKNLAGPRAEIQIRAQCLSAFGLPGNNSSGFADVGQNGQHLGSATQARAKPYHRLWRERDLQRVIAVARRSKLLNYRIELAADGTISIVVGK